MRFFITTVLAAALSSTAFAADDVRFTADEAYPEGVAWSAAHKSFFVRSVHHGAIGKVAPNRLAPVQNAGADRVVEPVSSDGWNGAPRVSDYLLQKR